MITVAILHLALMASVVAQDYVISGFGAREGGEHDNTLAVQRAVDACSRSGGKVVFPPGVWPTGTIYLKSNVHIYLSPGAVWQGVKDSSAYPLINPPILSREDLKPRKALVYAYHAENISITGKGRFYPGGDYEAFHDLPKAIRYYMRPYGIHMVECRNIEISGIQMRNSAFWMQRYFNCDHVRLTGLDIFNHSNFNNDGIDIDGCHNVTVTGCRIDASDDALVLKSEGLRACQDIVISNCILSSHATPLKCGTGSLGGFKRITISNIIIRPSGSKKMHHPIGSWRGLSGIDLLNVDGGIMEDILISNVVMDSVETPLFIKLGNRHDRWEGVPETTPGVTRNIQISNLTATHSGPISSAITGYPGNPVTNVRLNDIFISVEGNPDESDTTTVVRENAGGYPFNRMYGCNLPSYGMYIRHAEGISMNNVRFAVENYDARPAIVLDDARDITFNHLDAVVTNQEQPVIKIIDSENITVINSPGISTD